MIQIYHNPRCGKSREGLQILEESGYPYKVIKYLENIPSKQELKDILNYLDIKAEDLVRKNEKVWKEQYKGKQLSEDEIINAMLTFPNLIERPIVINNKKAVIGRPPENIKEFLAL